MRRTKTFGVDGGAIAAPASLTASGVAPATRDLTFSSGLTFSHPASWGASVSSPTVAQLVPPGATQAESYVVAMAALTVPSTSGGDDQFRRLCDSHVASSAPFCALMFVNDVPERPGAARFVYSGVPPGTTMQVKACVLCAPLNGFGVFVAAVGEVSAVTSREPELLQIFTSLRWAGQPQPQAQAPESIFGRTETCALVGTWVNWAAQGVKRTVATFLADGRFQFEDVATRQARQGQWRVAGSRLQLATAGFMGQSQVGEMLWQVTPAVGLTPMILRTSNADGSGLAQWTRS